MPKHTQLWLGAACFVLFLYLLTVDAFSQENKAPGLQMGQCLPIATAITHMKEKFREVVVFRGINHREQLVIIMANPLTDSWTALQSLQGVHLCIVAYGKSGAVLPSVEGKKL